MRRSSAPFGIEPGIDKVVVLGSAEQLSVRDLAVFTADLIRHPFDPVLESHNLFGGDFVQAVHGDGAIFRYVFKFRVSA